MNRAGLAIACCALAGLFAGTGRAEAGKRKPAPPPPPGEPDEIADMEAREANLESIEPRAGLVFGASGGLGIMLGGDIGVGRGPALSLRLGHVATRRTVITFEIVGSGALHKPAMKSDTLTDSNLGLFAGAQRYSSPSVWVRAAGGLAVLTKNVSKDSAGTSTGGLGALVGGGLDLARWGYLVLGLETFALSSMTSDGFKFQLGFNLGLTYY